MNQISMACSRNWLQLAGIIVCIVLVIFPVQNYSSHGNNCKWNEINETTATVSFKLACTINSLNESNFILESSSKEAVASDVQKEPSRILHLAIECTSNAVSNAHAPLHAEDVQDFFGAYIDRIGQRMPHLRQINIEFCDIRRLPDNAFAYLRVLHVLSIRNYQLDGANLELYSNSFWGLIQLTELDLSWNNVWSVPSDAFCTLPKLNKLNLSHNSLTELTQLDFSHATHAQQNRTPCSPYANLEVLDVSFNNIAYIAASDLSMLSNLKLLLLNHNHIQDIGEDGLSGLNQLQYIDLTDNRLVVLTPQIFKTNKKLLKLVIRNNSLSALTPAVFDGLNDLEVLDLSHNRFTSTWVNGFIFARLANLIALNLAHNSLSKIDEFLFYDFKKLQILDLGYNQIDVIHEKALTNLLNLKTLNLAYNKLRSLDKGFFTSGVDGKLSELSLENNVISSISAEFFQGMTSLTDLNLSGNLLIELPNGLGYLKALKSLDVGKNNIHFVDGNKFDGLTGLLGLRLIDNYISNLTSACFRHLPSLWALNLASNRLKFIDRSTFQFNSYIHVIRFDNNQIEDISNIFQSVKSLVWLNISDNKIKEFDYNYIPSGLEWLDMHKNAITELSDYEMQKSNLRISYLDASMNELTYLNDLSVPDNTETLLLHGNKINDIQAGSFLTKKKLKKIDLTHNELKKLTRESIKIGIDASPIQAELHLGYNPIKCDCHVEWLKDVNKLEGYPKIVDISSINCSVDNFRSTNHTKTITQVTRDSFLCRYDGHCLPACHCCEFDACDCEYICPRRCDCYYDEYWRVNIVDCGRAEYFDIPPNIPMDATQIYLDGNDIGNLAGHIFLGKKKLAVLFLNNSQIVSIHNRTFAGIPSLQRLHLENNFIQHINELMFESLENLVELFLNGNSIEYVPELIFKSHSTLKLINLANNRLKSLEFAYHLPKTAVLSSTYFRNNPWSCECLITDNIRIIRLIKKLCPMNKCNYQVEAVATSASGEQLIKREYIQILAAILVAIIGTTFLLSLVCVFRQNFMLWLFSSYKIRIQGDPTTLLDLNRNYDATIVFNNKDSDFVYRILSLELENKSFKVYHQDSMVRQIEGSGPSSFSYDIFVQNIEISKRVILVLSANFLNFEWKNADFRIALQNYLLRIKYSLRPYRIILVIAVPLDILLLDPILENLAKSCTRLFWGEKSFWEKLHFAMPDPDKYKMTKLPPPSRHLCEQPMDIDDDNQHHHHHGISKFNTQTYINRTTGHIYTTIAPNNSSSPAHNNSSSASSSNTTNSIINTKKDDLQKSQITLNGASSNGSGGGGGGATAEGNKAYFV